MTHTVNRPASLNPFAIAQHQFDIAADILDLDMRLRAVLRVPVRELHVSLPVRMDDGDVKVFKDSASSTTTRAAPRKAASGFTPTKPSTRCARSPPG